MFVFSVKATRKRLIAVLAGFLAVVGIVTLVLCLPTTQSTAGRAVDLKVTSAEERVQLLHELGYEVADETVQEIRLPDEPDAALTAYEALQTPAGLSLLKYSGKRVKLYTYTVTNAQTDGTVKAHVYIYRDRVIAGDITEADPNGTQKALI